ncbi:PREDICTED: protein MALE DISCOVERER 1-like isoform X2 [Camelina sativa]|uniref:Protein MALE DISCOVERER 1-like isoform X2 n=1 Tax=Camelina sativa TaxID=90675 RepID=A0ABM0TAC3_CAMSA|nr:PREDICTED: protein MALE DISCOVERER 1-like isoform X2 [Camelina sativa]
MSSDQRWRLLRPTFSIIFLFFLPHNLTFGLCFSTDALALMKFKERIERDPFGALMNWGELSHCSWSGVVCSHDGRVVILNLRDLSLQGTIAPELGNLTHLKSLILRNNSFSGIVPEEVTELQELEILDLYENNFGQPFLFGRRLLQTSPPGRNPGFDAAPPLPSPPPSPTEEEEVPIDFPFFLPPPTASQSPPRIKRANPPTESQANTPNPPPVFPPPAQSPPTQLSGVPHAGNKKSSQKTYIIVGVLVGVVSVMVVLVIFFLLWNQKVKMIKPWGATESSSQLQEVAITDIPKLKLSELEAACEDFSNIIGSTSSDATIYKGTLSTGSEIAVLAVASGSLQDWLVDHETQFQEKIQRLSQVNHKNFLNVIGYCHEDEPFNRMLVFEYAPNGSLFEHLHDQDAEHLDWPMRMRIVMGIAYCVEHMHNLNPKPISHTNLNSSSIYLATDYAAKVSDFTFLSSTPVDPMTNVVSFGTLLQEIITGKIPDPDSLLHDETNPVADPTLESFQEEVMEKMWEVVKECLNQKMEMKEVVVKLRDITGITAEAALPSRSPAWWAELEIISTEV